MKRLLNILIFMSFGILLVISMTKSAYADTTSSNGALLLKHVQDNKFDGSQTLLGVQPQEVKSSSQLISHADSNQELDLRVVMPLVNQDQLDNLIKDLYDPKSPNFRHFLTPAEFNQKFGPSQSDINTVTNALVSQGFSVSRSPNSYVLKVKGKVSKVEQFLRLHINNYKKNDGTPFYAPDVDPTIPVQLAGKIIEIDGLHNLSLLQPQSHKKIQALSTKPKNLTKGVKAQAQQAMAFIGEGGNLGPYDISYAYNLNQLYSSNISGSGQTMALVEFDGYIPSDVTAFVSNYSSYFSPYFGTAPYTLPIFPVCVDIYDSSHNSICPMNNTTSIPRITDNSREVVLDIDLALSVAPGLKKLYVYEAPDTWVGWNDEFTALATDGNLPSVISMSWGIIETTGYSAYKHAIFQQFVAQGQSVLNASGDSGAYANCVAGSIPGQNGAPAGECYVYSIFGNPIYGVATLSVNDPASDPYVTGVGISALTVNNPLVGNETYSSETASLYSGGGISSEWPIPSYQQNIRTSAGSKVSTTMRNVPDVSLTADWQTSYAIYLTDSTCPTGCWQPLWGSSAAAPIWAAFTTLVNQGLGLGHPIGFLNPSLYQIYNNVNTYATDFHDITSGTNSHYSALPGYDLATGLGSFNAPYLYNSLVTPNNYVVFTNTSGDTGTGTLTCNGSTCPVSIAPGTSITFKATPTDGSTFSGWGGACASIGTNTSPYTCNVVANSNISVSASFNNGYYITVPSNSVYGVTITPSLNSKNQFLAPVGSNQTIAFTYIFDPTQSAQGVITDLTVDGNAGNGTRSNINPNTVSYTFTNVQQPHSIGITNVMGGSSVYVSANTGGTISPSVNFGIWGWSQNFTVTPDQNHGYSLTDNGVDLTASMSANNYVLADFTINHTIVANFSTGSPQTITASAQAGGTISPSGAVSVNYGQEQTFSITPNTGTSILQLLVDGTAVTPPTNTYSFYNVKAAHTISTQFTISKVNNFTFQTVTPTSITLQWTAATGGVAPIQYNIQRLNTVAPFSLVTLGPTSNLTYTDSGLNPAMGYKYRIEAVDSKGNLSGYTPWLIPASPIITAQPSSQTVTAPATATFSVTASGTPTPIFQWQSSTNGGNTWISINGATGSSYTTPATTISNSGTQFNCVVSNSVGSVTSSAATLTVDQLMLMVSATVGTGSGTVMWQSGSNINPSWVTSGSVVVFTATPTNSPTISSTFGSWTGVTCTDATGQTGTTCTVPINANTNAVANFVSSTLVAPTITTQPLSVSVTTLPTKVRLAVSASGNPAPTYQWQQSLDGGKTWSLISGATLSTYLVALASIPANGIQYNCVVTNTAGAATSNAATVAYIASQPTQSSS